MGLEAWVALVRADATATDYHLKGSGRLSLSMKRYCILAALVSHVPDAVLRETLAETCSLHLTTVRHQRACSLRPLVACSQVLALTISYPGTQFLDGSYRTGNGGEREKKLSSNLSKISFHFGLHPGQHFGHNLGQYLRQDREKF